MGICGWRIEGVSLARNRQEITNPAWSAGLHESLPEKVSGTIWLVDSLVPDTLSGRLLREGNSS
jgi:hypothetical protein